MNMEKITLSQLLSYFNYDEMIPSRIQVVTSDKEWHEADELYVDSELLDPFLNYTIMHMGFEKSYEDESPILRVSIDGTKRPSIENIVLYIDNRTYRRVC